MRKFYFQMPRFNGRITYGRPVGVEVLRNSVGILKDISENYFTTGIPGGIDFCSPRYNYTAAVFSPSGFTRPAMEYAIAHQVFLIQYKDVPTIQPLIDAIRRFNKRCIDGSNQKTISQVRTYYRQCLTRGCGSSDAPSELTWRGEQLLSDSVQEYQRIDGSYFGMLQGQWPLHLLRKNRSLPKHSKKIP